MRGIGYHLQDDGDVALEDIGDDAFHDWKQGALYPMLRILAWDRDRELIAGKGNADCAGKPRVVRGCAHLLAKATKGLLPHVAHRSIRHRNAILLPTRATSTVAGQPSLSVEGTP